MWTVYDVLRGGVDVVNFRQGSDRVPAPRQVGSYNNRQVLRVHLVEGAF